MNNSTHAVCTQRNGSKAKFQIGICTAEVTTDAGWKTTIVKGFDAKQNVILHEEYKTSSHIQALLWAGCESVEFKV